MHRRRISFFLRNTKAMIRKFPPPAPPLTRAWIYMLIQSREFLWWALTWASKILIEKKYCYEKYIKNYQPFLSLECATVFWIGMFKLSGRTRQVQFHHGELFHQA